MARVTFDEAWSILLGKPLGESHYWSNKGLIPIGTLKPYEEYKGNIPEEDIVTIPFDPVSTPTTQRRALNVLFLGGSGDGKSLLGKVFWSVLHHAGYYCAYVDPKSTDSGRAVMKWEGSPRLAPMMVPEGIPREHFLPVWATRNYQHLVHNFRVYSGRLHRIQEKEMWQGLGMSYIAASNVAKVIKHQGKKITMTKLKDAVFDLEKTDLPKGSFENLLRVLRQLEDEQMIDDNIKELNLLGEWRAGKSICISYNNAPKIPMTFDIGNNIHQSAQYYFTHNNRVPIMWFLDDASFYTDVDPKIVTYNFAVDQIKQIGYNYRSLGVYNILFIQSLKIMSEDVAESYRTKLISPLFQGVDSLSSINIPRKAINYLRDGALVKDKSKHLMQWLLITEDNDVVPFFPFTPPANHFSEIYRQREANHGVES
jgi:hypothetical protein